MAVLDKVALERVVVVLDKVDLGKVALGNLEDTLVLKFSDSKKKFKIFTTCIVSRRRGSN